ncbi:DUF4124 domain-containing protein [Shewanella intestini]|uniref:DUF4124 domain-containing protein n=1 Tax=Shewanella intestini TaxID=2017544 RepID=A0ABS5I604_9GAMM|nr:MULTISPECIES: DUF4124 domain-containing protein [Shewanella]MBR9729431.1 DUF4124 domain-containing protein [Shewanella intestini]MRG37511.1 DUF4124 domain-containing protein [Shewanella sp. XMDDZSB0408]
MTYCRTITLTLLLAMSPLATAGVIYTWVDEQGVSHYSEQAPKGVVATKLYSENIEPGKTGYLAPKKKAETKHDMTELEKSAAIINATDKEQAKKLCDSAKHSLSVLTTYQRLTRKNEKTGETEQLTDKQKKQAIAENTERQKLFCK